MHDPRKTQSQNPYPRGQGTASVPVLFSLRNVQPSIVASASDRTVSANAGPATNAPATSNTATSNVAGSNLNKPELSSKKKFSPSSYNLVVIGLVAAVVGLAIQNSRNGRRYEAVDTAGPSTLASAGSVGTSPSDLPPKGSSIVANVPTTIAPASNGTSSVPMLASNPSPNTTIPSDSVSPAMASPTLNLISSSSTESMASKPPVNMPPLLSPSSSNVGPTNIPSGPSNPFGSNAVESNVTGNDPSSHVGPYGTSSSSNGFNESPASLSVSQDTPTTNGSVASQGNMSNVNTSNVQPGGVIDSSEPDLNTQQLKDLIAKLQRQNPSVPSRTVSGPQSAPSNAQMSGQPYNVGTPASLANLDTSNQMLSGQSYPPQPREYPPVSFQPNGSPINPSTNTSSRGYVPTGASALAGNDPSMSGAVGNSASSSNRYNGTFIQQPPAQQPASLNQPSQNYSANGPSNTANPARPYRPVGPSIPSPNGGYPNSDYSTNPGNYNPYPPTQNVGGRQP